MSLPIRYQALSFVAISCAALAVVAPSAAFAATETSSMGVSATVSDNCTVSASSVAFGNVNVISTNAATGTGGITVKCTNGTSWSATASVGNGPGASVTTRRMRHDADSTKTLNYVLYTDAARTTLWGDGTSGAAISTVGTGSEQARTIYASVPTGQNDAALGSYSDSVTVTVTY